MFWGGPCHILGDLPGPSKGSHIALSPLGSISTTILIEFP